MQLTLPQALLLFFLLFLLLSALLFPSPSGFFIPSTTPAQQALRKAARDAPGLDPLKVYIVDLARDFNYGLLENYYKSRKARGRRDLWLGEEPEEGELWDSILGEFLPYPKNPNWQQYSAEYWLLADLLTDEPLRASYSEAVRVQEEADADVFLVPFFCALSAEIQLGEGHGKFRKRVEENNDYVRQRKVMEFVMQTPVWRRSGGRDHVFMLTGKQGSRIESMGPNSMQFCFLNMMNPVLWHISCRSHGHVARPSGDRPLNPARGGLRRVVHGGRQGRREGKSVR